MDKLVKKLEERLREGAVPGTGFNRVLIDADLLEKHGLRKPKSKTLKESYVVWCLSVGELCNPKKFYYGFSLREAAQRALEDG